MIVERGDPLQKGHYVAYFGENSKGLVEWTGSQFNYIVMGGNFPFKVKGWIGPLPVFGEPVLDFDL